MRSVRPVQRSFLRQCVRDLVDTIVCGLLWIGLASIAVLQCWLLFAGELNLPDFLRESLSKQLSEQGLHADYSRVRFDPTGVILAEDIRLANTTTPEPLLTVQNLLVRIDPWRLLTGHVQITEIEGSGLNVFIPAFVSPSGRSEPVLADAQFRLHFEANRQLTLDSVSGRIAGMPVALDGSYTFPTRSSTETGRGMPDLAPFYGVARQFITIGEQLRQLGDMSIRGRAEINRLTLVALAPHIDLSTLPASLFPLLSGEASNVSLQLSLPYNFTTRTEVHVSIEHLDVTLPKKPTASINHLQARLIGPPWLHWNDWSALRLTAFASDLSAGPISLSSPGLAASIGGGTLPATVSMVSRIDGQPWRVDAAKASDSETVSVDLEGRPTAGMLSTLEPLLPLQIPLTTLLQLGPPPSLRAHAELAGNGLPKRIEGHLEGGGAIAYHVPIDEAAADFQWQGNALSFTNMLLRVNESEARGSYTMDIATHDFSFLLSGRLDPPDIGGWFHDWWEHFWADFEFPSPAEASVEVSGQWGDPFGTTVFVVAEGQNPTLRGQPLELLRTRLFIRPGWYDALDFYACEPGGGVADGRFGLSMNIDDATLKSLDFDFSSTLTKPALGHLLGPVAVEILTPYEFSSAPTLHLAGKAEMPDKREITLSVKTDQPFSFYGYAVQDLDAQGHMVDDVLTLNPMRAHFAGGLLTGRTVISGPEANRQISLDHQLDNAQLDAVLDALAARDQPVNNGTKPPANPPRRPGGVLKLTLQAGGPLDQPTRLDGSGQASITGAHLAQISLLGLLSDVLKATGLGFTSLSLENLKSSYTMSAGKLTFPDLRLSGPSAVVEASGNYLIDTQKLDFKAKLSPYEGRSGVFGNAADFVLSPLSKALEFQLTGDLEKPDWTFSYGPRGLLRALTGDNDKTEAKPPVQPKSTE